MTIIAFPLHRTRQHPRAGWTNQPQRLRISRHGPIEPLPVEPLPVKPLPAKTLPNAQDIAAEKAWLDALERRIARLHRLMIRALFCLLFAIAAIGIPVAALHLVDILGRFG